jgi:hypothetical protein
MIRVLGLTSADEQFFSLMNIKKNHIQIDPTVKD